MTSEVSLDKCKLGNNETSVYKMKRQKKEEKPIGERVRKWESVSSMTPNTIHQMALWLVSHRSGSWSWGMKVLAWLRHDEVSPYCRPTAPRVLPRRDESKSVLHPSHIWLLISQGLCCRDLVTSKSHISKLFPNLLHTGDEISAY